MKSTWLILIVCISLISCRKPSVQQKEFSLLGEWKNVSYSGSDGAKDYIQPIWNGRVLIFEIGNVVKDGEGNNGIYQLRGDSLQLSVSGREEFYLLYYDHHNVERINLSPVTNKYQIICDEGCAHIYAKID